MPNVTFAGPARRFAESGWPVARILRVMLVMGGVILVVWVLSDVLLLVFMAVLLAAMLSGLTNTLRHWTRLPHGIALTMVCIIILAICAGVSWWAGPRLADEVKQLWSQLSGQIPALMQHFGLGQADGTKVLTGATGGNVVRSVTGVANSTLSVVGGAFVVLVASVYFAIAPGWYRDGIVLLFPKPYRLRARAVMDDIGQSLKWWMLGQWVDMVVVGILAGVGLWLLGIPLAFVLAVIAALLTFVPYFGPIVSAIPAIIVALTVSLQTVLWVVVIYLICHTVEGYLVAPFVQRRTVELPPALTVLSMAILGAIFGVFGIIVATPLMASLLVIIREAYINDVLGGAEIGPEPERSADSGSDSEAAIEVSGGL
ncbi:MAG: AI-2E family transporter [Acetobacteraceae bacterium]|nr:AI-2E family transporter [Acetobacteraceae bacterium]